uniref:Acyltransferase C-terminal domain-containing protein n=1 Tax=Hyaloperonospora arabidopsidis (strain Emoy2) TaxID=559515 RepID=M4BRV7_HYAAE
MFYVDYAANERPSEQSLLSGRVPLMIYFYIERTDISAVRGKSENELAAWLETRFERKEALLKTFYESDGKLPSGAEPLFEESQGPATAVLVTFWVVLIGTAILCCLADKLFAFIAAGLIVAGYLVISTFGPGVDGYLVENCKPDDFLGSTKIC